MHEALCLSLSVSWIFTYLTFTINIYHRLIFRSLCICLSRMVGGRCLRVCLVVYTRTKCFLAAVASAISHFCWCCCRTFVYLVRFYKSILVECDAMCVQYINKNQHKLDNTKRNWEKKNRRRIVALAAIMVCLVARLARSDCGRSKCLHPTVCTIGYYSDFQRVYQTSRSNRPILVFFPFISIFLFIELFRLTMIPAEPDFSTQFI